MSLPNSANTVQGIRAHRIYIDEFALFKDDSKMLESILPSISHGGVVTALSRPAGKRGQFYRLVRESQQGKNNFTLFTIPYTECTLHSYQKNIVEIRKVLDEISFREQYMCEFIDETTSFFPYELLLQCIDDDMVESRPGMKLRFGIDFGRKVNSTVVLEAEMKPDTIHVRTMKEFCGVQYGTQLMYMNDRIKLMKPEIVNVDEFGVGIRLFEELRNEHGSIIFPVQLITNTKDKMIQDLRIMFEEKKIRIPRNDKLMQQLHALQRSVSGGYIKWEPGTTEDFGKHDDYVWALAMAVSKAYYPQTDYFVTGDTSLDAVGYVPEFRDSFINSEE
jgi:phage FluMu gp28-like protein